MDIQEIAAGIGSSGALQGVAAKLGMTQDQAQATLQGVLQQVSAGSSVEGVVEGVAAKTGVDPAQVQQFLPHVMGLLQGHADTAPQAAQTGLAGLMGSLQNSPLGGLLSGLDANKDGSIVDDALAMAKGLLGGKGT